MKAFKFLVPNNNEVPLPGTDLTYLGCIAVVVAETEEAARDRLAEWSAREGEDVRWLAVAKVRELPIVDGSVLAFVMF